MVEFAKWIEIAANGATALGILGFGIFYFTHMESQKQFKFNVMLNCIERFQDLLPLEDKNGYDSTRLRKYIDLTSEELFYFQQAYIPKNVIIEWLDSIVQNFPIYLSGNEILVNYEGLAKEIHDMDILKRFPRLLRAFTMNMKLADVDLSSLQGKTKLISEVGQNIGITLKKKHFKGAIIS